MWLHRTRSHTLLGLMGMRSVGKFRGKYPRFYAATNTPRLLLGTIVPADLMRCGMSVQTVYFTDWITLRCVLPAG